MSEEETLARVAGDLESGRLSMARQRLRGLVGSHPQRLDLREQLAELYRREGLVGQAGRWSYLSEQLDPLELKAFEREYPDPVHRMRAVGWRAAEDAGGELVRQRLMALRVDAEEAAGRPLSWEKLERQAQSRKTWGDWVFAVVVIVVLGLLLLGGIAFVVQGFQVALGWFGH